MNFKKNWKRFCDLSSAREGFTLVELIVVIAILAILAGVAVPAYSGYVTKANKQADMTLASEVAHALTLYYYAHPGEVTKGFVVLGLDESSASDGTMTAAMDAAFGDGWEQTALLKYDGWNAKFQGSSFYGDDGLTDLVTTVDTLTNALSGALGFIEGGAGFNSFAESVGAETNDEKANAAVFYVAEKTSQLTTEQMMQAIQDMGATSTPQDALDAMNATFHSDLSSAAALYALAEGYSRYYDEVNPNPPEGTRTPSQMLQEATDTISQQAAGGQITDALSAYTILFSAFGEMAADENGIISDYFDNRMNQDFEAYADVLNTVSASRDNILGLQPDLGMDNYFSSTAIVDLLGKYAEGCVFVQLNVLDGSPDIDNPLEEE